MSIPVIHEDVLVVTSIAIGKKDKLNIFFVQYLHDQKSPVAL